MTNDSSRFSPDHLGGRSVAEVRGVRDAIDQIARVTGLTPGAVRRRLKKSHGRRLVRNCFRDRWNEERVTEDPIASALSALDDFTSVALLTASEVRDDPGAWAALPALTQMSRRAVDERLANAEASTPVFELFEDVWGADDDDDAVDVDVDGVLGMTMAEALRDPTAIGLLCGRTGLPFATIEQRAIAVPAGTRVADWLERHTARELEVSSSATGKTSVASPLKGRVVNDRYELRARLGGGGFGEVYEVRDRRFPMRHIVMKLPRDLSPSTIEALEREYSLTQRFKHPNICTYFHHDIDEATKLPFLLMEYGGESLADRIETEGLVPLKDALRIVRRAAAALDHIHERGGVHADIKPENVLVTSDGHVHLTDFGIAAETTTRKTAGGGITRMAADWYGLSPVYAAPECPPARSKSDQYSLALVFCSMLVGEVFQEGFVFKDFQVLTPAQNQTVRRALSPRPRDRHASCGAFAEALSGKVSSP